ncbi:hypothetical protein C8F01DRAFT_266392 [Mycena amicta]|nr:hypothetical protein C8F01DRAFT_266392 [Mycena amicta]
MALAIDGGCLFQHLLEAPLGLTMRQLVWNIQTRLEVIHPPPSTTAEPPEPVLSKRQDALQELLSSEREYAADLTLILEVLIPLAQAPMAPEDIKIIFGNIAELASLSDAFCEALERTMGSALEKADATDDRIGELFLRYAPEVEGPYKQYITRHPSALAHLTWLPSTPQLTAYHTQTRDLASSLSHAWDLASLLIKPVQRLLKYSLLLDAIIEATSPTHPDRTHLVSARTAIEQVAYAVNEGRGRAEVVKEVLAAPKKPPTVLRIKSFRAPADVNSDAARVDRMAAELSRIDVFAQQLSRVAEEWARAADASTHGLLSWARAFAAAIGLSTTVRSEAFDAFLTTLTEGLLPIAASVLPNIASDLLSPLARLLATADQPRQLLASMKEHAPLHHHLLTMTVSAKSRPPLAIMDASARYIALRTQLAVELPVYLSLLHRGLAALVRRLAVIQAAFFFDTREVWAGLWNLLRVEGERNGGGEETVEVWRAAWEDVDQGIQTLKICKPPPARLWQTVTAPPPPQSSLASSRLAPLEGGGYGVLEKPKSSSSSKKSDKGVVRASDITNGTSNNSNSNSSETRAASKPGSSKGRPMSDDQYMPMAFSSPRPAPLPPTATRGRSRPPSPERAYSYGDEDFQARRSTWLAAPAQYSCRVVHACTPPSAVSYFGFPFFALEEYEILGVLHEAGHPSTHPRFPLYVNDGEDCLLFCRDSTGELGWALASFLAPLAVD